MDSEYDTDIKKIVIQKKSRGSSNLKRVDLDGHIEIKFEYLKHLHGSYIKFSNNITQIVSSGGFIQNVSKITVTLRQPAKQDTLVIQDPLDHTFYVKDDNPNYLSLRELLILKENLEYREKQLQYKLRNLI
jgi:hypothetical protein